MKLHETKNRTDKATGKTYTKWVIQNVPADVIQAMRWKNGDALEATPRPDGLLVSCVEGEPVKDRAKRKVKGR